MRDYLDQDPDVPPTSTVNLGPYASFLADLPNWRLGSELGSGLSQAQSESGSGPSESWVRVRFGSVSVWDPGQARIRVKPRVRVRFGSESGPVRVWLGSE